MEHSHGQRNPKSNDETQSRWLSMDVMRSARLAGSLPSVRPSSHRSFSRLENPWVLDSHLLLSAFLPLVLSRHLLFLSFIFSLVLWPSTASPRPPARSASPSHSWNPSRKEPRSS